MHLFPQTTIGITGMFLVTSSLHAAANFEWPQFRSLARNGLAALGLMFGLWMSPPLLAGAGGATAIKANDFLNSIGVCTHIVQGADNPTKVAEALTYTGIRVVREDASKNPKTLQTFIGIHHATGTKFVLLPMNGDVAAILFELETLAAEGALLATEGPN